MKAVFIDIETTGLDYMKHVPLEIAMIIYDLEKRGVIYEYEVRVTWTLNDFMHFDKDALELNGFGFECVSEMSNVTAVKLEIKNLFRNYSIFNETAIYISQNPAFDAPFFHKIICSEELKEINAPYHWLDLASMVFYENYFCHKYYETELLHDLSKDNIARYLSITEEEKPHRAMRGVKHLLNCFEIVTDTMELSNAN